MPGATRVAAGLVSFSAIDRVWSLAPCSLLAVVRPVARVGAQPERLQADGLGDHTPLVVERPAPRSLLVDRRPVPREVAEDESMAAVLGKLHSASRLDDAPEYADPMRDASRVVLTGASLPVGTEPRPTGLARSACSHWRGR